MFVPTILLFVMGLLGATDIVVFHMRAHDLRHRTESRAELVTHFLRGPTYAFLFLSVPNFRLEGAWFVALLAVLAFDVAISIADFWLEPASRASAGGLPRGEYVLHVLLAMLFGAVVAMVLREAPDAIAAPTSAVWITDGAPAWVRLAMAAMAPIALGSSILDLAAVLRPRLARA